MDHQFRNAVFGGFNRQDVLDYLETLARENAQKRQELEQSIGRAEGERDELCAQKQALEEQKRALEGEKEELLRSVQRSQSELAALRTQLGEREQTARQTQQALEESRREAEALREQVARLEEVQTYVMFNGNVPPSGWQPTGGDLWLKTTIETRELTAKEAQALYDAAWRDIRAENVLPVDGDYAWLGVEITLFRDGDSRTISSTKSSYKELTQALLDLGIPAEDIGEINID